MTDATIPTDHGDLPAYVGVPSTPGPWPGVVVIHDVMGFGPDVRNQTDWLAGEGFLAVAPNLFHSAGRITCVRRMFGDISRRSGRSFDDVESVRAWLAARPDCTGKIGVIGFCMGGGFALVLAPARGFAASSVNYGPVPKDAEALLAGACPVIGSYGGRDGGLRGAAGRLEQALTHNGVPHDVKEYPDAGHGFLNDHVGAGGRLTLDVRLFRPITHFGPHEESTRDARQRITEFFATHLR
jgi:carboxymethylenebutenolidase